MIGPVETFRSQMACISVETVAFERLQNEGYPQFTAGHMIYYWMEKDWGNRSWNTCLKEMVESAGAYICIMPTKRPASHLASDIGFRNLHAINLCLVTEPIG